MKRGLGFDHALVARIIWSTVGSASGEGRVTHDRGQEPLFALRMSFFHPNFWKEHEGIRLVAGIGITELKARGCRFVLAGSPHIDDDFVRTLNGRAEFPLE